VVVKKKLKFVLRAFIEALGLRARVFSILSFSGAFDSLLGELEIVGFVGDVAIAGQSQPIRQPLRQDAAFLPSRHSRTPF